LRTLKKSILRKLKKTLWLDFQRNKINQRKVKELDILVDISGVGKTFNILGNVTKQYMILCSCDDLSADSQMKDMSFLKLMDNIHLKKRNRFELISQTPRLIFSFLFSILIHLWILLELYPEKMNPTQFALNQLNRSNIELENFCFNIQKYSDDNLLSKENLLNHCTSLLKEITEKRLPCF
jgi:hypothetical protein